MYSLCTNTVIIIIPDLLTILTLIGNDSVLSADRRSYLPEQKVRLYMYQLCKSIYHMHRNGIFHRDVKPENILIKVPYYYFGLLMFLLLFLFLLMNIYVVGCM